MHGVGNDVMQHARHWPQMLFDMRADLLNAGFAVCRLEVLNFCARVVIVLPPRSIWAFALLLGRSC